jgi:hypothetical protein
VYQIEQEMPAQELRNWARYLEARPIGWKEDNRTSMLLSAQGVKKTGDEIFPTLAQVKRWEHEREDEDVMRSSLKKSVFGALLENANKKD